MSVASALDRWPMLGLNEDLEGAVPQIFVRTGLRDALDECAIDVVFGEKVQCGDLDIALVRVARPDSPEAFCDLDAPYGVGFQETDYFFERPRR